MILINNTKLLKLNLRSAHNHSGEQGEFTWKVIDWNENEKYCSRYDYKIAFQLKSNGRPMGTHMFYNVGINDNYFVLCVNYIILHHISQGRRPTKTDLMQFAVDVNR